MTWTTTGADYATMGTGLSALAADFVWGRNQLDDRRQRKRVRSYRNWHGYIDSPGIDSWYMREAEQPEDSPLSRILIEVVDRNGHPDVMMGRNLRLRVEGDGMLARLPTPEEYDFLADLRKKRFDKGGFLVRLGWRDEQAARPPGQPAF